jgi:hypothetical protein
MNRFAVVAVSLAMAFTTATFVGSHSSVVHKATTAAISTTQPALTSNPTDIGLPGDSTGWCVFSSGVMFTKTAVWTCYVALYPASFGTIGVAWVASWPTSCGWQCKTTFTPSHGVATGNGEWVKIQTTIGGCANYNLSFKTSTTTLRIPVYCG